MEVAVLDFALKVGDMVLMEVCLYHESSEEIEEL